MNGETKYCTADHPDDHRGTKTRAAASGYADQSQHHTKWDPEKQYPCPPLFRDLPGGHLAKYAVRPLDGPAASPVDTATMAFAN